MGRAEARMHAGQCCRNVALFGNDVPVVARKPALSEPSMMTIAPPATSNSPPEPHIATAASATGAVLVASSGTLPIDTICTPR